MGRKAHKPTELTRYQVKLAKAAGHTVDWIAEFLGVGRDMIFKYYREELDSGAQEVELKIVSKLYENCMKGKEKSIFFFLQAKCGWRVNHNIELSRIQPPAINIIDAQPINKISAIDADLVEDYLE